MRGGGRGQVIMRGGGRGQVSNHNFLVRRRDGFPSRSPSPIVSPIVRSPSPIVVQHVMLSTSSKEENSNELVIDLGKLLMQDGPHADVTFVFPDGTNVRAHRGILSVRSPVFAAMFAHQTTEALDGRVQIEDISVAVFKLLLAYIYTAKIADAKLWESALDLFKAADKYSLQSLKKSCEEALSSTVGDAITVANVCEVLVTGEMYSSGVLKRAAVGFIRRNGNAVMLTAAWRQLMRDQPRLVDYVLATVLGIPPPKPGDYKDENGERVELTIIQ